MAQTPKPQNPQINRAHPLARGLVAAWPMWEGGGDKLRDIARGHDGTLVNSPTWKSTQHGTALALTHAASGGPHATIPVSVISSQISFSAWVRPDFDGSAPTFAEPLYNIWTFGTGDFNYDISLRFENRNRDGIDNTWGVFADYNTVGAYLLGGETQTTIVPGDMFHLVVTMDFAADNYALYVNGALADSSTASISLPTLTYAWIGCENAGAQTWEGEISDVRVHNRVLTAGEVKSAYVSPWALYTRPLFGMPNALYTIGGGSSDTVGADATAGFSDLLSLTSGLLSVPPLAATAGYKSVMSMCGVYIDSAGLPLPSGGGGKGVRRRRIPMVLFDDAEDGIVINAALDSFGAI